MRLSNGKMLSVISAAVLALPAQAALITLPTASALAGSTLIDFETLSTGNATSFTVGGVTFSTPGGSLRIAPFGEGGTSWNGSGQTLTTQNTTAPSRLNIDFGGEVSAFGMDWGAANPDWTARLFNSANTLIETLTFSGGDAPAPGTFREFYGASGNGITRAELTAVTGQDWVIIDNFQLVRSTVSQVPEPASLALVALGLLGAGMARRKRGQ